MLIFGREPIISLGLRTKIGFKMSLGLNCHCDDNLDHAKFAVSVIQSRTVQPEQATKREIISLSGLDRVSPAMVYTVFFYRASEKQQIGVGSVETVRKALEKVFVSWYPAAGRFGINEETGKLELDCNGAGAVLLEARSDVTLEDLGVLWDYKPFYEKLVPQACSSSSSPDDLSLKPLVVAQVTRFGCGSLSIGFGYSHSLLDGIGAFNFLKAWAALSKGRDDQELLQQPNHSRELLSTTNASANESIYSQFSSMPVLDLYGIPTNATASDDKSWEKTLNEICNLNKQGCDLQTFFIKEETLETMKNQVLPSGQLSGNHSTFEVLAAHLWRARVKALGLNSTTKICLQFPVDARNRLEPPLGQNFSGNAFVLASTSCYVSEVIEEPLHCTVRRVQTAKNAVRDEYIRSYLKALEASDKFFPSMRELTIVSDWRKIPFHCVDFGWGKAACAAPLATPVPQTIYIMQSPDQNNAGVHIRLGLHPDQVDSFQNHLYN